MRQRRRIGAYGACWDKDGQLLLVRSGPHDDAPGAWSLPGGGLAHGEGPQEGLLREFTEETGLVAEIVGLRDVVADLAELPQRGLVMHTDRVLYDVKVNGGRLRNEVGGSSDLAAWVAPDEAADLPLLPFVSRLLGLPVSEPDVPVAEPAADPAPVRRQRFAAYGLVTDPAGRVLLTRIADGYPGAGTWHLPGGGTDFGEQATTGLLRELVEETAQHGRVTGLEAVTHHHNPRAMGPEGRPMDWHTVRALYRVVVDEPGTPSVVEAAGGSTAEACWFERSDLGKVNINQFARTAIAHHLG
jgi:ADP-ribose pyrophosphatase YjhB (NUDIX family)